MPVELSDTRSGSCHADVVGVVDLKLDIAARHVDSNVVVDEPEFFGDRSGSARTAAAREGVAGAAFPDFNLDIGSVEDFEELDVGAV